MKRGANYYRVDPDPRRQKATGLKIVNLSVLQSNGNGLKASPPWPKGVSDARCGGPWRFPEFVQKPRIVVDRKLGHPPRDVEFRDSRLIISPKMKSFLEFIDPESCEFRECDVFTIDGEPTTKRWLCSITRAFIGAINLDRSKNLLPLRLPSGFLSFGFTALTSLYLDDRVIGDAHMFHVVEISASVLYCDEVFRAAYKGSKMTGLQFAKLIK